jgi:RimJ/RimL family protein N-acetyltransferase
MQERSTVAQDTTIRTQRLELVPSTVQSIAAELGIGGDLGRILSATVPRSWPPELVEGGASDHVLIQLSQGPHQAGWWSYYVVRIDEVTGQRTLVGSAGFCGTPEDGVVEVCIGILREQQKRGFGSEALAAVIERAFAHRTVTTLIAETRSDLAPSLKLLSRLGFEHVGQGRSRERLRYELERSLPG